MLWKQKQLQNKGYLAEMENTVSALKTEHEEKLYGLKPCRNQSTPESRSDGAT